MKLRSQFGIDSSLCRCNATNRFCPRIATWLISKSLFSQRLGPVAKVSTSFLSTCQDSGYHGDVFPNGIQCHSTSRLHSSVRRTFYGCVEDASGDFNFAFII